MKERLFAITLLLFLLVSCTPTTEELPGGVDRDGGAVEEATRKICQVVILDTAGRIQIDAEVRDEGRRSKEKGEPHEGRGGAAEGHAGAAAAGGLHPLCRVGEPGQRLLR